MKLLGELPDFATKRLQSNGLISTLAEDSVIHALYDLPPRVI
jgi:hypothetical protein